MMETVLPIKNDRAMIWAREDRRATAFRTTLVGGPKWQTVNRRVTTDVDTGEVIEDLAIYGTKEQELHGIIFGGPRDIKTTLF